MKISFMNDQQIIQIILVYNIVTLCFLNDECKLKKKFVQ